MGVAGGKKTTRGVLESKSPNCACTPFAPRAKPQAKKKEGAWRRITRMGNVAKQTGGARPKKPNVPPETGRSTQNVPFSPNVHSAPICERDVNWAYSGVWGPAALVSMGASPMF